MNVGFRSWNIRDESLEEHSIRNTLGFNLGSLEVMFSSYPKDEVHIQDLAGISGTLALSIKCILMQFIYGRTSNTSFLFNRLRVTGSSFCRLTGQV